MCAYYYAFDIDRFLKSKGTRKGMLHRRENTLN